MTKQPSIQSVTEMNAHALAALPAPLHQQASHCNQLITQAPRIAIVGQVNAGKSSLVNLLAGANVAPVQDIRTTSKVDTYQCTDFCLEDTPGTDSLAEHDRLAALAATHAEVTVLVIKEGCHDDRASYQLAEQLHQQGTPAIVLVNLYSTKDQATVLQQVNQHLTAQLGQHDFHVLALPIKLVAQLQTANKHELLTKAGYSQFQSTLSAMAGIAQPAIRLRNLAKLLIRQYQQLITDWEAKAEVGQLAEDIEAQKTQLANTLEATKQSLTVRLHSVATDYARGASAAMLEGSQEQLLQVIDSLLKALSNEAEDILGEMLATEAWGTQSAKAELKSGHESGFAANLSMQFIKQVAPLMDSKKTLKNLGKWAKKLGQKSPKFRKLATGLGKVAKLPPQAAAGIATAAFSAVEVGVAHHTEKKQNAAARMQANEAARSARELVKEITTTAVDECCASAARTTKAAFDELDAQLAAAHEAATLHQNAIQVLNDAISNLEPYLKEHA